MTNPVISLGLTRDQLNELAQSRRVIDFVAMEQSRYQRVTLPQRCRTGGSIYKLV